MKKGENKSSTSIGASLTRITGKNRRATTISSLSTWVRFCYTKHMPWILATCHICNMQALYFMCVRAWVCACVRTATTNQMVSSTRPGAEVLSTRVNLFKFNLCVRYSYSYSMYSEFMSTSVYFSIYTVKTNLFVVNKIKLS